MKQLVTLFLAAGLLAGCANKQAEDPQFHTSGDHEADQRAAQQIAKSQQAKGKGQDATDATKQSLYERIGGEKGITAIVDNWVDRAMADPRINWNRKGVSKGGFIGVGTSSAEWKPTSDDVANIKLHMSQFIALASGGPSKYSGRGMKESHAGMAISNDEFSAAAGDLKATLDLVRVPVPEQKELLAIVESTRPQIVEQR